MTLPLNGADHYRVFESMSVLSDVLFEVVPNSLGKLHKRRLGHKLDTDAEAV
jgi:hypothetical protein